MHFFSHSMSSSARRRTRAVRTSVITMEHLESRAVLAAAVAGIPDLVTASDSGWPGDVRATADNKTSVTAPTFSGTARNAVSVAIFNGATQLGTAPVVNNGWTFSLDPAAALAAGRHAISAQATNAEGVAGVRSRSLAVEVITAAPSAPTVGLQSASDSGAKGDGITNVKTPVLAGFAPAGSRVILQIDGGAERVAVAGRTGAWSLKAPALADGSHSVSVRSESVVGLRSEATTFTFTIDSVRPMAKLEFLTVENQVEVTFSRAVRGLSLGHFVVSGNLGGRPGALPLNHRNVVAATGGFVLEPKPGAPAGTVFRIRSVNGEAFGGDYRISLTVPRAGIVETESGADNLLGLTTNDYGPNVRGNAFCFT